MQTQDITSPQEIMRQITPRYQPVPLYLNFIIHNLFRRGLPPGWGK